MKCQSHSKYSCASSKGDETLSTLTTAPLTEADASTKRGLSLQTPRKTEWNLGHSRLSFCPLVPKHVHRHAVANGPTWPATWEMIYLCVASPATVYNGSTICMAHTHICRTSWFLSFLRLSENPSLGFVGCVFYLSRASSQCLNTRDCALNSCRDSSQ